MLYNLINVYMLFAKLQGFKLMLKLRLIKAAVLLMTFLLLFGTVLLIARFAGRIGGRGETSAEVQVSLEEPDGSQIVQISSGPDRLYILVNGGNRPDRIIIFDHRTQRKISNININ